MARYKLVKRRSFLKGAFWLAVGVGVYEVAENGPEILDDIADGGAGAKARARKQSVRGGPQATPTPAPVRPLSIAKENAIVDAKTLTKSIASGQTLQDIELNEYRLPPPTLSQNDYFAKELAIVLVRNCWVEVEDPLDTNQSGMNIIGAVSNFGGAATAGGANEPNVIAPGENPYRIITALAVTEDPDADKSIVTGSNFLNVAKAKLKIVSRTFKFQCQPIDESPSGLAAGLGVDNMPKQRAPFYAQLDKNGKVKASKLNSVVMYNEQPFIQVAAVCFILGTKQPLNATKVDPNLNANALIEDPEAGRFEVFNPIHNGEWEPENMVAKIPYRADSTVWGNNTVGPPTVPYTDKNAAQYLPLYTNFNPALKQTLKFLHPDGSPNTGTPSLESWVSTGWAAYSQVRPSDRKADGNVQDDPLTDAYPSQIKIMDVLKNIKTLDNLPDANDTPDQIPQTVVLPYPAQTIGTTPINGSPLAKPSPMDKQDIIVTGHGTYEKGNLTVTITSTAPAPTLAPATPTR